MPLPNYNNLVAHWKMNDNSSDSIVSDSKGLHPGTWTHGFTSSASTTGKINSCLNFDGVNDYVEVDNHSDFNLSTFSFCAWLKHSSNSIVWDRILSKKNFYFDSDGYEISLDGSNTDVLFCSGSSDSFSTISLGVNWLLGEWNHLVVIYQGSVVTVYFNNILKTTGGSPISPVVGNSLTFRLGKIISEDTTMWDGSMDDIRFYNMALTSDQVSSIYNLGNGTEADILSRPFVSFLPGVPSEN